MLALSVLDQSVALSGTDESAAIRDTVQLAQHCEQLGYARFWVSEHHALPTIVGSAPEVLLGAVAATTSRIRLGSAGVMLPHYSPFKVAEQFRVLESLAPGRIDLGVGRAPGGEMRTARALNPHGSLGAEDFPDKVRDLQAWTSQPSHLGIAARPLGPHAPQLWILGSSDYGAALAAEFGLPYAFAYFFSDGEGVDQAIATYRARYKPSARHPKPQATVCVWALAADTAEEAAFHALSRERWRVDRVRGVLGPLQSPEAVAARGFAADEREIVDSMRRKAFVGTGEQVAAKLHVLAEALGLDEIVINTWAHDPVARRRSYALLAQAAGLAANAD